MNPAYPVVSTYRRLRVTPWASKVYELHCHACWRTFRVELSRYTSTGFHFTHPLPCEHCGIHTQYAYRPAQEAEEAPVVPQGHADDGA